MLEGLTPPRNKAHYCKVADTMATLNVEDVTILTEALNDRDSWPASTLSTQLRLMGLSLADTTITKHRNQACVCYRG